MIPLIFAFSIVILPGTMATYFATTSGSCRRHRQVLRGPAGSHVATLLDNGVHPGGNLHLLLHSGSVQPAELSGESTAERWIRSGHQAGAVRLRNI